MKKSELIKVISKNYPNLGLAKAKKIINIILGRIVQALSDGDRIEIRGFFTLSVRKRQPRIAHNPRTNKIIQIDNRYVVYFRTGKEFQRYLNPSNDK